MICLVLLPSGVLFRCCLSPGLAAGRLLAPCLGKVGHLLPPLNLRIDLNGQAGVMILRWNRVAKALSYFVQCADATTDERVWTDLKTISNRKLILTDMEIGKMYAFRVASIGGSTGQSLWCPEVLRMAA